MAFTGGCTVQAEHRSRLPPPLDIPEGENSIISWWEEANPGKPKNANRTPLMFSILGGYQSVGSVPNRPVRPALGMAGLTQAFSETAGPECGKPAFQKKKPGLAWVTCRPQG